MTSSAVKNNFLPPGLVSNLQQVLLSRKGSAEEEGQSKNDEPTAKPTSSDSVEPPNLDNSETSSEKPLILVTNGDGIESPGLTYLVEALVREGLYNVHVCAPQS